jgi:hypothetical protein
MPKITLKEFSQWLDFDPSDVKLALSEVEKSNPDDAYKILRESKKHDAARVVSIIYFDYGSLKETLKKYNKSILSEQAQPQLGRPERLVFSDFKIYDRNTRELLTKKEMVSKLNYYYPKQDRATIEIIIDIFLNGSDELKRITDIYSKMSNDIARQFFIKLIKKPKDYSYAPPDPQMQYAQKAMEKKKFNKYALPPSKRIYHPGKM